MIPILEAFKNTCRVRNMHAHRQACLAPDYLCCSILFLIAIPGNDNAWRSRITPWFVSSSSFRKVVINAIFSFLALISFVLMGIMFSMGSYINTFASLILTEFPCLLRKLFALITTLDYKPQWKMGLKIYKLWLIMAPLNLADPSLQ